MVQVKYTKISILDKFRAIIDPEFYKNQKNVGQNHIRNCSNIKLQYNNKHLIKVHLKISCSRDRLMVRILRCGRSNPGSNPGHGKV